MPKTTKTTKTANTNSTSPRKLCLTQLLLILTGLAGLITFSVRLATQPEINLTALENEMNSSATSVMLLESTPVDFNDKSFSRTFGDYLVGESTAWYTHLTTLTSIKFSLDLLGLFTSIVIFALGLRSRS